MSVPNIKFYSSLIIDLENKIVKSIMWGDLMRYDDDDNEIYATESDLDEIVYKKDSITIESNKYSSSFKSKNKEGFTLREIYNNILELETISRPKTLWFGNIDISHIYFEGLLFNSDNNIFIAQWGS